MTLDPFSGEIGSRLMPSSDNWRTAEAIVSRPKLDPDADLRAELCRFAKAHPRWGYRRAHAVLCCEGWVVNRKKLQRL